MPNTNWLHGMACPKCGSEGPFDIFGSACFTITDNGPVRHSEPQWDDDESCWCHNCHFEDAVAKFETWHVKETTHA